MEKIKKKLQSQGGITILLALLGFMVAAMVSVVVVTAAVSAAKRVENDRDITQDRLTLESAAQLVRDQMTGEDNEAAKTSVTKTTLLRNGITSISYTQTGTFGNEMMKAVQWIDTYNTSYESSAQAQPIEITVSDFDTVYASYVMQPADEANSSGEYYLIFTFSLDQSSEQLYLTMNAQEDTTNPTTTAISWKTVSINGLGGSSGN